uniref:Uncharacterized protein n=1 Tax=Polytomella parva TaxID=51329 RepID=A0A7S0YCP8_9CHLO|mmetsp:Transcript_17993/g.32858  ORF Transcript_17993/g.32858 Transcript_17993/m.32858 type:complete len:585 (+) Transcript_17993:327-2081(+)
MSQSSRSKELDSERCLAAKFTSTASKAPHHIRNSPFLITFAFACCVLSSLVQVSTAYSTMDLYNGSSLHILSSSSTASLNSSLISGVNSCEEVESTPVLVGVLSAAGLDPLGLNSRADFIQAYACSDNSLSLCNALAVLEGSATIEANNSYIALNNTQESMTDTFSNLMNGSSNASAMANTSSTGFNPVPVELSRTELREIQNNTLLFADNPSVLVMQSTLSFQSWNWFVIRNASVEFKESQLEMADWFTWVLQNATVKADQSVISHRDISVYLDGSTLSLSNLTWNVSASSVPNPPPGGFSNLPGLSPTLWIRSSTLSANSSQILLHHMGQAFLTSNSTLSLINSTLDLVNTSLFIVDSHIDLQNAAIKLREGAALYILCGSSIGGENELVWAEAEGTEVEGISKGPLGNNDVNVEAAEEAKHINIVLNSPLEVMNAKEEAAAHNATIENPTTGTGISNGTVDNLMADNAMLNNTENATTEGLGAGGGVKAEQITPSSDQEVVTGNNNESIPIIPNAESVHPEGAQGGSGASPNVNVTTATTEAVIIPLLTTAENATVTPATNNDTTSKVPMEDVGKILNLIP